MDTHEPSETRASIGLAANCHQISRTLLSYGVYLGEVLAPILVILGLFSRLGALIIIANMLFVFGLVHMADLLTLSKTGGWTLELQGFFLFTGLAVLLLGAGRFSLGGINGRWN